MKVGAAPTPAAVVPADAAQLPGTVARALRDVLTGADTEEFLHGIALVSAELVIGLGTVDGVVTATVDGERRQQVRLAPAGTGAWCRCPQGRSAGAPCEHAVAVALAELHRISGTPVNDLVAAWFAGTLAEHLPTPSATVPADPGDLVPAGAAAPVGAAAPAPADATSAAVAGLVDSLDAGQARGLLLALAHDLPEVAEILADLAGPPAPTRPAGSDGAGADGAGSVGVPGPGASRLSPAELRAWRDRLGSALTIDDAVGWDEAASYAADVEEVGDDLDALLDDGYPEDVRVLLQRALTLLDGSLGFLDDSDGEVGTQVEGLLELHHAATARSAEAGLLDPLALGEWLASVAGGADYLSVDIGDYLDLLGADGVAAVRDILLAAVQGDTGTAGEWAARWALERLALRTGTLEDIVAAVGPLDSAARYARLVSLLTEAGHAVDAGEWAVRGLAEHGDDAGGQLAGAAVAHLRALGEHDRALATRRSVLRAHPDVSRFRAARALAVELGRWEAERPGALRAVRRADIHTRLDCLLADDDPDAAWSLAHSRAGAGLGDRAWLRLCDVRAADHPADTLAVYERIARSTLRPASPSAYVAGVEVLGSLRRAARAAGTPEVAAHLVTELAQTYARRPRFLQELRRAGLLPAR